MEKELIDILKKNISTWPEFDPRGDLVDVKLLGLEKAVKELLSVYDIKKKYKAS